VFVCVDIVASSGGAHRGGREVQKMHVCGLVVVVAVATTALQAGKFRGPSTSSAEARKGWKAQAEFDLPLRPTSKGGTLETMPFDVGSEPFRVVAYTERRKDRLCAYLEYLGDDEAPAFFGLTLKRPNGQVLKTFPNNGGAIDGGQDQWRCGLTFCSRRYSGSRGRARDWGAAAWPKVEGDLYVEGFVRVFERSSDGAVGCGSVVVPLSRSAEGRRLFLEKSGLREGEEYRVMAVDDGESFEFLRRSPNSPPLEGASSSSQTKTLTVRPASHNRGSGWPKQVALGAADVEWCRKENPRTWGPRFLNEALAAANGRRAGAAAAVLAWLLSALAPLPLVLFAKTFVGVYVIPSESMAPTLRKGDVLVVENYGLRYDRQAVHRGDIVLFKPPPRLASLLGGKGGGGLGRKRESPSATATFVKRVAFQEGDDVEIDGRDVRGAWLQANKRRSRYVAERPPAFCDAPTPDIDRAIQRAAALVDEYDPNAAAAKENLDPSSTPKKKPTTTLKSRRRRPSDDKKSVHVVQPGSLFVLGDCAGVSIDSRVWGDLPSSFLVGTPTFRLWPPTRVGPISDASSS